MTDPEPLQFAADFPAATREEWRKLVDAVLKGTPFERLVSHTYDGLAIEPLAARRLDARPVAARPGATTWEIMSRIDHPDPALANEIALRELGNGATGLTLVFAGSRGDHGFGLPATEAALERTLEGVVIEAGISIEVDLSPPAVAVIDAMLARGRPFPPPATKVRLGHDPLGAKAIAECFHEAVDRACAAFCPPPRGPGSRRFPGNARRRRRACDPQFRRVRSAGIGLRSFGRAGLSARARSRGRRA